MVALFLRQEAVDQRRAWFPRDCLAIASVDVGRRADVLHCTACCVVPCPTGRFRRFGNAPKGERPRVRSWKQRERHQEPRERGRSAHRGIRHARDPTRTSRDPKRLSNLAHVDPKVIRWRGRGIGPRFVIDTFPRRYRRRGRDFDTWIDFSCWEEEPEDVCAACVVRVDGSRFHVRWKAWTCIRAGVSTSAVGSVRSHVDETRRTRADATVGQASAATVDLVAFARLRRSSRTIPFFPYQAVRLQPKRFFLVGTIFRPEARFLSNATVRPETVPLDWA